MAHMAPMWKQTHGIASVEELLPFFSDNSTAPVWVEDDNCVQSSLSHS